MSSPVEDLSDLLTRIGGPPPTGGEPAEEDPAGAAEAPAPHFPDLETFLRDYLAQVVERRLALGAAAGINWCPQWWSHPEAISRLYALWRAWESLRVSDPHTGMSVWWRDHLDPHLNALTSETGAFARCGPDRGHVEPTPLPLTPAPPEVLAELPDART